MLSEELCKRNLLKIYFQNIVVKVQYKIKSHIQSFNDHLQTLKCERLQKFCY